MRSRVNGGLIGPYQVPGQTVTSTVRSIDEASRLVSGGQWPGSIYAATNVAPVITTVVSTDAFYANIDDTAILSTGGYVRIFGSGFTSSATVYLNGNAVVSNTFVNSGEIRALLPGYIAGTTATLMVFNGAAGAIYLTGVAYSNAPSWVTATGSLATVYETTPINNTVQATGDGSITYAIDSGNLPSGVNLNPLTGVLSGTAPADSGSTTYNFTIRATDAQNQDSYRLFSLTINTDSITWVTPAADGITYNLSQNIAMSDVTVNAVAGTGSVVTYSANALPTGLSLLYGVISGTPTVVGSNVSLITATSTTTSRTATRLINWTISIASDLYWKFSTLLLTANAAATGNSVVTDSSITNAQITVFGDARAHNFNPYSEGYYSIFFPATGSYLTGSNALFSLTNQLWAWTFECWIYPITSSTFFAIGAGTSFSNSFWIDWGTGTANKFRLLQGNGSSNPVAITSSGTYPAGQWYHVAVTNDTAGVRRLFVNGIQDGTQTYTAAALSAGTTFVVNGSNDNSGLGANGGSSYISNLRFSSNVTLYTSNFIPATSSLTSVAGTSLLAAKSQRILDASPNNFTITTAGTPRVASSNPFANVAPTSVTIPNAANYSVYFDGTGDYLSPTLTGQSPGTSNFTYECWFYISSLAATRAIMNTRSGDTTDGFDVTVGTNGAIGMTYSFVGLFSGATGAVVANRWYHLAIVRTDTSTVTVYLNGVSQGNWTSGASSNFTSTTMYIGASALAGSPMLGHISNFRYTKSAVYTAAFTPSTTPLIAIDNTQLLTCQNSTLIDNSTNAFTITANGDARPARNGPFIATTALALTGTEGSAYFDGTGDYLQVSGGMAPVIGQSSATVEFWVYPLAVDSYRRLITTSVGAFTTGDFVIRFNNGTFLAGDSTTSVNVGTLPTINQWNHVAWVGTSGTAQTLYINGAKVGTAGSYNITATMQYIGGYYTVGPAEYSFGYMSGVRVVKGTALYTGAFFPDFAPLTAVTNTQLLTLQNRGSHNNSAFIDEGSIGNVVVRTGNATNGAFTPYGNNWSYYFDGNGDYLTVPYTVANFDWYTASVDFTIEMWIYPLTFTGWYYTGSPNQIPTSIGNMAPTANTDYWSFGINGSGQAAFYYYNGAEAIKTSTATVSLNTWSHIAMTKTASGITLFVNGTASTTTAISGSPQSSAATVLSIGAVNSTYVNGYMSTIRIVRGTAVYTGNFTPSTTPLISVANTTLLTGRDYRIVDNSPNNLTITKAGDVAVQKFSPFATVTVPAYYSGLFNGSTDYLTVPASQSFAFGTGDFTVEAWVYTTARNATYGSQIAGPHLYGVSADWLLTINPSGNLYFQISGTATGAQTSTSTVALSTWTHVVVTRASGTVTFYINGVSVGSGSYATAVTNASTALGIGGASNGSAGAAFTGYISNLRITKGVALYTGNFTVPTAPLSTTQSAGANIAALTGIPTGGNSVYFNGSTDYLSLASNNNLALSSGNWTVEFWIYPTSVAIAQNIIIDWRTSNNNQPVLYLVNAVVTWRVNAATLLSGGTIVANTWTHVALVKNSTTTTLYINGVSATSASDSVNYAIDGLQIGKAWDANYWNGYISNLRIVKGLAIYTGAFTPSTSPLALTQSVGTNIAAITGIPTNGNSVFFNGTTDYLTAPTGTAFNFSTSNFTVEGWIYTTTLATEQSVFDTLPIGGSSTRVNAFVLVVNATTGTMRFYTNSAYSSSTSNAVSINTWTHFAIVKSSGVINIYINGVLGLSVANTSDFSTGGCVIGRYGDAANGYYNGYISNLRVVKGTALYTAAFTPSTTPLSLVSGTSFLTCQATTFVDNGGGLTITRAGNPTISQTHSPFGYSPSLLTCQPTQTTVVTDNSLGNLPITVNGTARASRTWSPFGYTPALLALQNNTFTDSALDYLTITAATNTVKPLAVSPFTPVVSSEPVPYSPARFGGSMYFDGTGDVLTSPGSTAFTFGADNFTVEYWVYVTAVANTYNQHVGAATTASGFAFGTNGSLSMYMTTSTTGYTSTGSALKLNQWHHIAYCRVSGTVTFFLDGVVNYTVSAATTITETNYGMGNPPSGTAYPMTGYLAGIRVTKGVALYTSSFFPATSPATPTHTIGTNTYSAALLLNGAAGAANDATRTIDLETVADARVVQNSPYSGSYYSNYFDGTGDYLSVAYNAAIDVGTGDFTLECWVFKTTTSSDWRIAGGPTGAGFFGEFSSQIGFGISTVEWTAYYAGKPIPLNTWAHVAWSRSSNTMYVFINGVLAGSTSVTGKNYGLNNGSFLIGSENGGSLITGYISSLRLVKGTGLYTTAFTPSTTPLTAVSGTGLLTCQNNRFVDNSTNAFTITKLGDTAVRTQNPFRINAGVSYYFDGTGDYLKSAASTPALALGSGDFTIEFWVQPSSLAVQFTLVDFRGAAGTVGFTDYVTTNGKINLFQEGGTTYLTTTGSLVAGVWTHVAYVRSSGTIRVYFNGVADATTASNTTNWLAPNGVGVIGVNYTLANYFTGHLTDFRITRGYARYTATFTPPTEPFIVK